METVDGRLLVVAGSSPVELRSIRPTAKETEQRGGQKEVSCSLASSRIGPCLLNVCVPCVREGGGRGRGGGGGRLVFLRERMPQRGNGGRKGRAPGDLPLPLVLVRRGAPTPVI